MFGYAHYVHNLPHFLMEEPEWNVRYLVDTDFESGPPQPRVQAPAKVEAEPA